MSFILYTELLGTCALFLILQKGMCLFFENICGGVEDLIL